MGLNDYLNTVVHFSCGNLLTEKQHSVPYSSYILLPYSIGSDVTYTSADWFIARCHVLMVSQ